MKIRHHLLFLNQVHYEELHTWYTKFLKKKKIYEPVADFRHVLHTLKVISSSIVLSLENSKFYVEMDQIKPA